MWSFIYTWYNMSEFYVFCALYVLVIWYIFNKKKVDSTQIDQIYSKSSETSYLQELCVKHFDHNDPKIWWFNSVVKCNLKI